MTQEERMEMLALMREAIKPVDDKLANVEQRLGNVEQGLANVEQRQTKLEQGQAKLEQRQTKLELVIENEVDRAIKAIAEGHDVLNRKLDKMAGLPDRVETLEHKVSAVEYALKQAK